MIREKEWSVRRLPSPTSPSHALFFLRPFYSSLTNDRLYEAITMAKLQAPVVQTLDSAIHQIKVYPVDNAIGFPNTYPLDSDLSSG